MKLSSKLFASLVITTAVVACSSNDASTGASSGGSTVAPSCYVRTDGTACDCVATNDDANRAATDYRKVTSCNASTLSGSLSCITDTSVDGKTTSCTCNKISCWESGDYCYCGASGEAAEMTSCSGYEWCCAKLDGSDCHCGNGVFGSGCANEEHNVTSCTKSSVKLVSSARSSCDGLSFAAPPPSGGGGGGGDDDGECSSSSECSGKCSTRCYDCRSHSCVCGRIGSSGSCIY